MNNFSKMMLLILITASLCSIGWNAPVSEQSNTVTNYYYYEGHQYFLNHKPDMIYVKLKSVMSKTEFENLFSSYGTIAEEYPYVADDRRQFIKLKSALDNVSINNVINQTRTFSQVEYSSPVFGMREGMGNANTLIGCEGNIIAQFKPSYNRQQIEQYLSSKNMTIVQQFDLTGGLTYLVKVPAVENLSALDYANNVYSSGLVNYCDPDFMFTNLLQYTPNDTYFPMQWSAINTGSNIPGGITGTANCDMGLDSAWNQTLGSNKCIISVVDSGIDTLHEDLAANIYHGYQYNYYAGTPGGADDFNHGTACAGIIAAVGNNNIGVTGVCPNGKLFSAKIFNSSGGGATSTVVINALIGVRTFGNCWVSSNSWGGGSPNAGTTNAINDGVTLGRGGKGIVWCFATGNSDAGTIAFPSNNENVISVGGNSPCNQRKSMSPVSCDFESWWGAQYGDGLDIVAPCVKIYTTDRTGGVGYSSGNYVADFNGTSSATPNCSGVAALMLSKDSTQRWDTVRARINRTALKKGSYSYTSAGPLPNLGNTWNNQMGYGIINANLALLAVVPVVGIIQNTEIPASYSLSQNYPNPFNPSTSIQYALPKAGIVSLKVFDIMGREVASLVNGFKNPGVYNISFNAANLSSGVYFYKLESGEFTAVQKMTLIK